MATEHKPLFNPLYLKALIMILPVLIILLASLGPDAASYPEIEHSETQQLYWIEQPDRPDNELRLLLPAAVALDPEQRILQQTLAALLQHRLHQPALQALLTPVQDSQVTALSDHLQISLHWPAGEKLPELDAILQALQQTPESDAAAATLARIRAQAYLEGQDPAQRLLNRLQQQLQRQMQRVGSTGVSAADVLQQYHRLFTQAPLLILGGPDAERLAGQLNAAAPGANDEVDKVDTVERSQRIQIAKRHNGTPSQPLRLRLSDARLPAMYLLGASMPGRDAEDYAAELLAIRSLQRALELRPDTAGHYRLVWQQSRDSGYRALILEGQPTRAQTAPQAAQRAAAAPVDERVMGPSIIDRDMIDTAVINAGLIDDTRQQLLQQLREHLQTPQGQLDQLATLAFNNLTGQRLDTILDQLQAVPGDDIGPRIAHYLAPETQILITLNGQ